MAIMKRSLKERFEEKFVKGCPDRCWEWMASKNGKGYGQISVGNRTETASRVAYRIYVGEIPSGVCVLHRCDNPICVNPNHLFLGSQKDNIRDCSNKGRLFITSGERNAHSKLTKMDVIEIRLSSMPSSVIKDEYGVTKDTINKVRRRATWKNV